VSSVAILASCGAAQIDETGPRTYTAVLSGANERPVRATNGVGTATFRISGSTATYDIVVSNLTGSATVAQLLVGTEQTALGQIIFNLGVTAPSGTIAVGTIDLSAPVTFNNSTISGDALRALLESGGVYVNVYSTTYPGGEVRGQVRRQQ
jgi:hypothetical protein